MLRLSKKADYALMAMKHLARKTDSASASTSAREIAEQYDIPIELMAKVLQRLARNGLLTSHQGTRGGYTLSRTTASISVADIIQAIDGPLTVTACSTEDEQCERQAEVDRREQPAAGEQQAFEGPFDHPGSPCLTVIVPAARRGDGGPRRGPAPAPSGKIWPA
jgi:Rrf2 family protein